MKKATHHGELPLGKVLIPCFVLEDKTRVLSDRGLLRSLDVKGRGRKVSGHRILGILDEMNATPLINNELSAAITNPAEFEFDGKIYHGHSAEVFVELLEVFSHVGRLGLAKTDVQRRYIRNAELFRDALVGIGLVALIDEHTGYQTEREANALQEILDKYLQDHHREWSKTFPDRFWTKLVKIKGYDSYAAIKRPAFVGHWINDIVYDRLVPGIRKRLNEINPKIPKGQRRRKHHQFLTEDHGLPELKEHLIKVMALMDAAANETQFKRMLNRVVPKYGDTIEMNLDEDWRTKPRKGALSLFD